MINKEIYIAKPVSINKYYNDYDPLSLFANKTGFSVLRDRFGYLNVFSPWNLYKQYKKFPSSCCSLSFSYLMDKRANDIIEKIKKENKQLYIFLSGGVDSTAMTIAILKSINKELKNAIHIIINSVTEFENPEFVKHLYNYNIDIIHCKSNSLDDIQEKILETDYALVGWAADQLFGSIINQSYPDWYKKDWKEWLIKTTYIGCSHIKSKIYESIDQFEEAFNFYNLPIHTFGEFAWFMNFSAKYDIVTHNDVLYSGKLTNRMISFYDTEEFNDWSVSNFDNLHNYPQQDTEHYKIELKNYIYSYNKDSNYKKFKGKLGSWGYARQKLNIKEYPNICIIKTPDTFYFYKYSKKYNISKCIDIESILMRNFLRGYRKGNFI